MKPQLFEAPRTLRDVATDDQIIAAALCVMEERFAAAHYGEHALSSPNAVRDYLRARFLGREHEEFHVMYLDARNRLIAAETAFTGTLTRTSVYPREIVKAALKHNAATVILAHNHPSGVAEPSAADRLLTRTLKDALAMVDCTVLDHAIVAGREVLSFAERGLL